MENKNSKIKEDIKNAKNKLKERIATADDCLRKGLKAGRKPLIGLGAAVIMSSFGMNKLNENSAEQDVKQNPVEQVTEEDPYKFGYNDADEVVETSEEIAEREIEEEFERIRSGEYTHGDAGTDKTDYGTPGEGSPRLTEQEAEAIYRIKSKVGYGLDDVELNEIDQQIRGNSNSKARDISLSKAIRDAGHEK